MPQIRTFGRNLELDSDEMDSIERYRENGSSEMFWETVRVWMSKNKTECRIRTLLKAIEDTGIDLKGIHLNNITEANVNVEHYFVICIDHLNKH